MSQRMTHCMLSPPLNMFTGHSNGKRERLANPLSEVTLYFSPVPAITGDILTLSPGSRQPKPCYSLWFWFIRFQWNNFCFSRARAKAGSSNVCEMMWTRLSITEDITRYTIFSLCRPFLREDYSLLSDSLPHPCARFNLIMASTFCIPAENP